MGNKFADTVFTDSVKEMQELMGSRKNYARMQSGPDFHNKFTDDEIEFIKEEIKKIAIDRLKREEETELEERTESVSLCDKEDPFERGCSFRIFLELESPESFLGS